MLYGRYEGEKFITWEDTEITDRVVLNGLIKRGIFRTIILDGIGEDYIEQDVLHHYNGVVKSLEEEKEEMIQKIYEYDSSEGVNSFWYYGHQMWIDVELRGRLQNSTKICIKNGKETVTYWHEGVEFVFPCELFLTMLDALEMYALDCFNITAQHVSNVSNLTTVEEIRNYDYKSGYPEKLDFTPKTED